MVYQDKRSGQDACQSKVSHPWDEDCRVPLEMALHLYDDWHGALIGDEMGLEKVRTIHFKYYLLANLLCFQIFEGMEPAVFRFQLYLRWEDMDFSTKRVLHRRNRQSSIRSIGPTNVGRINFWTQVTRSLKIVRAIIVTIRKILAWFYERA